MANQKQLEILKQGVEVWNKWREDNTAIEIDLSGADLDYANLILVNLDIANLGRAKLRGSKLNLANLGDTDLSEADLNRADLRGAYLFNANLSEANLSEADLSLAHLENANLSGANLSGANLNATLSHANLSSANLSEADLSLAHLENANLSGANLSGANLKGAESNYTIFAKVDLSNTIGLEFVKHQGASTIGTNTLLLSKGNIPEIFLRGCGLSDWEIESAKLYDPDLNNEDINKVLYRMYEIRATQALQISPLFISYSHADSEFADRMEKSLNEKGIRFWRDIHHATAGKLEKQIDRAISQNPTVLVILSKNSLNSDWVQHEVRKARNLEKEIGRDVLCPVALDDSWENSNWPERIMEQMKEYNILSFSEWKDDEKFEKMFVRLIDGLNLYYKKEE